MPLCAPRVLSGVVGPQPLLVADDDGCSAVRKDPLGSGVSERHTDDDHGAGVLAPQVSRARSRCSARWAARWAEVGRTSKLEVGGRATSTASTALSSPRSP